jgi:hypothetical protein
MDSPPTLLFSSHHLVGAPQCGRDASRCASERRTRDAPSPKAKRSCGNVEYGVRRRRKPYLWGFRMRTSNRSDLRHCLRNVSVTVSNRRIRTRQRRFWNDSVGISGTCGTPCPFTHMNSVPYHSRNVCEDRPILAGYANREDTPGNAVADPSGSTGMQSRTGKRRSAGSRPRRATDFSHESHIDGKRLRVKVRAAAGTRPRRTPKHRPNLRASLPRQIVGKIRRKLSPCNYPDPGARRYTVASWLQHSWRELTGRRSAMCAGQPCPCWKKPSLKR